MNNIIDGKMLLELDLLVNPTANDNIYIFDNTTKKSKRTTLGYLQNYLNTNVQQGNSFSGDYNDLINKPNLFIPTDLPTDYGVNLSTVATTGNYNDLLNLPTLFSPSTLNADYGVTLSTVATSGDYNDLSNLPTLFSPTDLPTDYGITLSNVATSGNFNDLINIPNYTLSNILTNGNTTGSNDISIDNGQKIISTNGNSYFDPRYNSADSIARLHASDTLYISTNFRQKIIIGHDQSSVNNGSLHPFVNNSVYQQVQITGVNLRGNISFGNGLSSSSPIIGIGSDYAEIRLNTLFFRWNNGTYGGASFQTNGGAKFSFIDVYNRQMLEISRINANSRQLALMTQFATSEAVAQQHRSSTILLQNRYWSKNVGDVTGLDVEVPFTIENERYSENANVDWNALMKFTYNGLDTIKFYEDGSIGLDNVPTSAPTQTGRVWSNGGVLTLT